MVDVRLKREFRSPVTLATLRNTPSLAKMPLLARGNRLSVLPVAKREWETILKLERG
jgi:predicted RNA-binding protein with PUA-like domain